MQQDATREGEDDTPTTASASRASERAAWTLPDVAWLAVAGAVFAALASLLIVVVRLRLFGALTWTSRDFAVLSWAGNMMVFLLALPPVLLVSALGRRAVGLTLAAIAFAFLAGLTLTLMLPRVHPLAQVALALGVATQVGGRIGRAPGAWMPIVRRFAVSGTLILWAVGGISYAQRIVGERRALAALGPVEGAHPNILLLILDTVRAANLSAYGYHRPTSPALERVAREGTLFVNAFSAASWTAPSHASMMTGRRAIHSGADYLSPMDPEAPTVAEVLARRGYVTGAFMANAGFAGHQQGLARGFSHFEDYLFNWGQALWSSPLSQTASGLAALEALDRGDRAGVVRAIRRVDLERVVVRRGREATAEEIGDNFIAWRERSDTARPYFAMLNFIDAHAPYSPPGDWQRRFDGGRRTIDKYDGSIAYVDSIIGLVLDRLRARGELDNTVVIVTADHGELFGEHGMRGHGGSLYLPVTKVPLIVRAPGLAQAGVRVPTVVSLRDLAATLVELGGGAPGTLPGTSLAPLWSSGAAAREPTAYAEATKSVNPRARDLTRAGPIRGVVDSSWHYLRYGDGREELFAWRVDSAEANDLSRTATSAAELDRLRGVLQRAMADTVHAPSSPSATH